MAAKPEKKAPARKLETLTIAEMIEQWPHSDEGRLCARLLQRYSFSLLVQQAAHSDCGPMTAQAEMGKQQMLAIITQDFGKLAVGESSPAATPRMMIPKLNRFKTPEENQKPEKQ